MASVNNQPRLDASAIDDGVEIRADISAADESVLLDMFIADLAGRHAPQFREEKIALFHRDPHGKILAALTGRFLWDWLYISMLIVDPSLQKQGWGQRLMQEAEAQARKRRCTGAYVMTQSFQAPGFYQKQGYEIFGQFPDFPKGHQRIGLRKIFSAEK